MIFILDYFQEKLITLKKKKKKKAKLPFLDHFVHFVQVSFYQFQATVVSDRLSTLIITFKVVSTFSFLFSYIFLNFVRINYSGEDKTCNG